MTNPWNPPDSPYPPPPVPLRAMPLDYVQAVRARRPGIVTAIGVMSVVIGSLSIFANLMTTIQSVGFIVMSRVTVPAARAPRVTATGTLTVGGVSATTTTATNEIRGWPAPARGVAIRALAEIRPMNDARRARLDALLAECGRDVFPFDASRATVAQVKANVSEHGVLPPGTTSAGADYFLTGNGRISVSDDEAAFSPADRSGVVRVTSAGVVDATNTTAPPLTPATLPAFANPFSGLPLAPFVLLMLTSLASFGLAIYLLVIGILVLRHSPRGARLHWAYVWIKLPLAVVGALAYGWMMSEMMRGMGRALAGAGAGAFPMPAFLFVLYAVIMLLISCAYPIGLIFTLRSRSVREYYGSISEARAT